MTVGRQFLPLHNVHNYVKYASMCIYVVLCPLQLSHIISLLFTSLLPPTPGLTHTQEREVTSLSSKLSEAVDDASKERKAHNQLEREKATLQFSVKTLQQKHDELLKIHQQATKELQDMRAAPTASKDQAALAGKRWSEFVSVNNMCTGLLSRLWEVRSSLWLVRSFQIHSYGGNVELI